MGKKKGQIKLGRIYGRKGSDEKREHNLTSKIARMVLEECEGVVSRGVQIPLEMPILRNAKEFDSFFLMPGLKIRLLEGDPAGYDANSYPRTLGEVTYTGPVKSNGLWGCSFKFERSLLSQEITGLVCRGITPYSVLIKDPSYDNEPIPRPGGLHAITALDGPYKVHHRARHIAFE